jgi:hypothetical protein
MRNSVVSALFLATVLVVGATWVRLSKDYDKVATLTAVGTTSNDVEAYNIDTFWPEDGDTPDTPYNATEAMSRSLITDYINLASSGQADEATLKRLVDQYVDTVPDLNTAPTISKADLHLVEDSRVNFQNYDRITTEIQTEQQASIMANYSDDTSRGVLTDQTIASIAKMGDAYEKAAIELRDMEVPKSLSVPHLKLVNNYFATAAGMRAVALTNEDTMTAFAGMVAVNSRIKEEPKILNEILALLSRYN